MLPEGRHRDALLLVEEQVVHRDLVAFHAGDFADADDLSATPRQTPRLHHHLDGAGDLRAQGTHGDIVSSHGNHHFHTR